MSILVNQLNDIEQRRQAVLKAAFPLFAHQGFNETSIEQIARHAGLSLEALTHDFPLKIDILLSKLIYADRTHWEAGYCQLYDLHDPIDALYGYCSLVAEHFLDVLGLPLCRELVLHVQWGLSAESQKQYAPVYDLIQEHLRQLLRHLKEKQLLNVDSDIDSIAQVLTDVGHSFCARLLRDGSLKARKSGVSAREAIRLFFVGVRAL